MLHILLNICVGFVPSALEGRRATKCNLRGDELFDETELVTSGDNAVRRLN